MFVLFFGYPAYPMKMVQFDGFGCLDFNYEFLEHRFEKFEKFTQVILKEK